MLYISKIFKNKYGVVDTDDWSEEFYTKVELRQIFKLGIKIKGLTEKGIKIVNWTQEPEYIKSLMLGYKFKITDSNYVICDYKPDNGKNVPKFCVDLKGMSQRNRYKFKINKNNLIVMTGKYRGENLYIPCFVGKIEIKWGMYEKVSLSGGSGLVTLYNCFTSCPLLKEIDLKNLVVSKVTNMAGMFSFCSNLQNIDSLGSWNVSNVEFMSDMFLCCGLQNVNALVNWNVENVISMKALFSGCKNLKNIDALVNWNVSHVSNMHTMFSECISLYSIDSLRNWDVSNVRNMESMFSDCRNLQNIDALINWNVTNVTNMDRLFYNCNSLRDIRSLQNWSVDKVESIEDMFVISYRYAKWYVKKVGNRLCISEVKD